MKDFLVVQGGLRGQNIELHLMFTSCEYVSWMVQVQDHYQWWTLKVLERQGSSSYLETKNQL
jgi:hypothetical protein